MKGRINKLFSNHSILFLVFFTLSVTASIQSLVGTNTFRKGGPEYTSYNNYIIFKKSFHHLINQQDLYVCYPQEYYDLYKYTPTFSVLFGIFSNLPDWLGLNLWNLLNALLLFFSIVYLPRISQLQKGMILLIVTVELMTSLQNEQSNALIAGLIIFTFNLLERNKLLWATLCIVASAFIKLFGVVGFALFLFYPNKWKATIYTLMWTLLLLLFPLLFISVPQYVTLFKNYLNLLSGDHSAWFGISVMGLLNTWFSIDFHKNITVLTGCILFLIPFLRYKLYKDFLFRILILSSILIWIVIFNHKAESPTFIIAMAGVAFWFIVSEKNILNILLFISAMLLTSLSPTDLIPKSIRNEYIIPYTLKALPCILIWLKIIYDLLLLKPDKNK